MYVELTAAEPADPVGETIFDVGNAVPGGKRVTNERDTSPAWLKVKVVINAIAKTGVIAVEMTLEPPLARPSLRKRVRGIVGESEIRFTGPKNNRDEKQQHQRITKKKVTPARGGASSPAPLAKTDHATAQH